MKELFGIPMSTFATILVVMLAICLLIVAYIALRKPIVFKMGLRSIPRRPAQTILIVIGLMLSTLIVASALGVGDTLDTSVRGFAFDQLGEIDQIIVTSDRGEADTFTGNYFPEAKFADVETRLSGMSDIDGLLPTIYSSVATINDKTQLANSQVFITGLDPSRLGPFGGIKSTDGKQIDLNAFPQGTVVVSEALSEDLGLKVGDTFTAYVSGRSTDLTVGAIARNSALLGFGNNPDGTTNSSAFAMALPQAQAMLGHPGELNSIFVTMTGGVDQPKDRIKAVNAQAASRLSGSGLGIYQGKADFLDAAEGISTGFTSIFIVLGLFSIAAGILLIVLIFTMLAAERRPEMGMARAVGQRRLQLIQQFIAEGSGYALAAGVVGAAMGIAATFLMGAVLNSLLGDAFPIHARITSTSLISAYALGVVITFVTVVAASWKVSRLNIVAAVRDIPDITVSKRRKRTLVWGGLLILAGVALTLGGTSSGKAFPFYAGISLLPFGIAMFAQFFGVPGRLAFSLVGLWLVVVWLLPDSVFEKVFGKYDGGIEMFFLSGIFLVIGSTILIVQNTTTLLRGVTALGGLFKSKLAAVKLAVAYPGQARGRTGMAIAMFSLIIFSLVMIATISENLTAAFLNKDALAGWNVQADTNAGQPVPDFQNKVAQAPIDQSEIKAIGKLTRSNSGMVPMQETGPTDWPPGQLHPVRDGSDIPRYHQVEILVPRQWLRLRPGDRRCDEVRFDARRRRRVRGLRQRFWTAVDTRAARLQTGRQVVRAGSDRVDECRWHHQDQCDGDRHHRLVSLDAFRDVWLRTDPRSGYWPVADRAILHPDDRQRRYGGDRPGDRGRGHQGWRAGDVDPEGARGCATDLQRLPVHDPGFHGARPDRWTGGSRRDCLPLGRRTPAANRHASRNWLPEADGLLRLPARDSLCGRSRHHRRNSDGADPGAEPLDIGQRKREGPVPRAVPVDRDHPVRHGARRAVDGLRPIAPGLKHRTGRCLAVRVAVNPGTLRRHRLRASIHDASGGLLGRHDRGVPVPGTGQ